MSFQDAPKTFAEEGLALLGWPSSVMYPPASHQAAIEKFNIVAGKKNHHQGIRSYDCVPVREVLQGFRAGIIGLVRRPVEGEFTFCSLRDVLLTIPQTSWQAACPSSRTTSPRTIQATSSLAACLWTVEWRYSSPRSLRSPLRPPSRLNHRRKSCPRRLPPLALGLSALNPYPARQPRPYRRHRLPPSRLRRRRRPPRASRRLSR